MSLSSIDRSIRQLTGRWFLPFARVTMFVVFFWFGFLKLLHLSPATPLAMSLVAKTIGSQNFTVAYTLLALIECAIGVLFVIPKYIRIAIPLLVIHMVIVSGPLLLLPSLTWHGLLQPTLEGQYIIKNLAFIALAIGFASQTNPIKLSKRGR